MESASDKIVVCPGCGQKHDHPQILISDSYNTSTECFQTYGELTSYTIGKRDIYLIHQHVIDTYSAQHAGGNLKHNTAAFSLIGLYYAVEFGFNGRQIQRVYTLLNNRAHKWDEIHPPDKSAYSLTVFDVMKEHPGENRDKMLQKWMNNVWSCWDHQHHWVKDTCAKLL